MRYRPSGISFDKYADMLELPNHTSPRHPRLSKEQRAAQFSPFKALTGYEEAIMDTADESADRVAREVGHISFEEIEFGTEQDGAWEESVFGAGEETE